MHFGTFLIVSIALRLFLTCYQVDIDEAQFIRLAQKRINNIGMTRKCKTRRQKLRKMRNEVRTVSRLGKLLRKTMRTLSAKFERTIEKTNVN